MLKRYKLCFEIWGLLLFFIIMIPNFIWFAIPAPNDILRAKSITEIVDTVASIYLKLEKELRLLLGQMVEVDGNNVSIYC